MDFGVVFQCDPPASTVVDLARKAEDAGFVTNGPTVTRLVSARIAEWITYGSCQSRCESKVHTWLNPCASASLAS